MSYVPEAEKAAIRKALWSCIDALGVRGQVEPTDTLINLVNYIEALDFELMEALVLGVFITNAAEQQMTLAVEASTAVADDDLERRAAWRDLGTFETGE